MDLISIGATGNKNKIRIYQAPKGTNKEDIPAKTITAESPSKQVMLLCNEANSLFADKLFIQLRMIIPQE
jgi:hypothetical protein